MGLVQELKDLFFGFWDFGELSDLLVVEHGFLVLLQDMDDMLQIVLFVLNGLVRIQHLFRVLSLGHVAVASGSQIIQILTILIID